MLHNMSDCVTGLVRDRGSTGRQGNTSGRAELNPACTAPDNLQTCRTTDHSGPRPNRDLIPANLIVLQTKCFYNAVIKDT